MKTAATVVGILVFAALMNWARGGLDFHIAQSVPLLSGDRPGLVYIVGGLVVLLITASALRQLIAPAAKDRGNDEDPIDDENPWDQSEDVSDAPASEEDEESADE